ncbi:GP46-like surface antigen, putative [Bodo saltans]|uniref:GP46-like surface antigen, putative n=1 Tax=Bodo saltans TaxID=75058 RepID=A0A0S4J0U7_BODSA|nr:GP46-like surface antigen, putative [Bodo saltans]|eukprot:CUG77854.1 GP46-like surface antigen, putative [Bodo saltans]
MRPHEVLSTTTSMSLSIVLGTSSCRKSVHVVFVAIFLIQVLVMHPTAAGAGMCGCEHRYDLLMEFYNTTNGSTRWRSRTGWGTTSPCSTSWYGITCNDRDVTIISLPGNYIQGTLPISWWNMSSLWYLYLYSNSLSGTLPVSWGNMSSLWYLDLSTNSLSGTLPASWGNVSNLLQLYLSTNSLSGTLPASWGNMSSLRSLYLYSNELSGTLPSSWSTLLCRINVSNNCLTGSIPTIFSAATSKIQWIDVCNTGVWPRNFSQKIVAMCTPNTIRRCITCDSPTLTADIASLSRSSRSQSMLASMSRSAGSSPSLTTSLSLTSKTTASKVGNSMSMSSGSSPSLTTLLGTLSRTVTTLTLSSVSLSCMSPTLSCGTIEVKLVPFISVVAVAPPFMFVDIVSPDAGNEALGSAAPHVIVVHAIDRAELLQDPVVRMNISLMTQAFNTKRWDLANITMTGIGPLLFTIVNRSDDVVPMRWLVVLVDPPTRIGGWVTNSVPLFVDATFSMNLLFSCDVESTLSVP